MKPGVSDALVGQVDLIASFATLTGRALDAASSPDSRDVLPALLGASPEGREWLVTQAGGLSVVAGRWRYIEPRGGPRRNPDTNVEVGNDAEPQLYDTEADPGETRNLGSEQPEKVKELAALLARVRERR